MRSIQLIVLCLGAALALYLFAFDGMDRLSVWALEVQRQTQRSMALGLRALKAGEPGALLALLSVCFVYGVAHAGGPGHGKVLLGAYGLASRATLLRLSVLAFASAFAQALTAIALVGIGALILGLGRDQVGVISDEAMTAISLVAVGLVGSWLIWRGAKRAWRLWRAPRQQHSDHGPDHAHDHGHHHHHHADEAVCSSCGHRHAPSVDEAARVHSLRDAIALIFAIGIRPCTGAVFVLLLTFQMGIPLPGIAAVLAMALGTGMFTAGVALGAGFWRQNALPQSGSSAIYGTALLEVMMGALVVAVSVSILRTLL